MNTLVFDATNAVLGRLTSTAAKKALVGNKVIIINCNQVLITGRRRMIIEEYKKTVERGGHSLKGPFFIKRDPARFVKRTVRGMLNYKQARGLQAFKNIMCYNTVPAEYATAKHTSLASSTQAKTITLSELTKEL